MGVFSKVESKSENFLIVTLSFQIFNIDVVSYSVGLEDSLPNYILDYSQTIKARIISAYVVRGYNYVVAVYL